MQSFSSKHSLLNFNTITGSLKRNSSKKEVKTEIRKQSDALMISPWNIENAGEQDDFPVGSSPYSKLSESEKRK